MQQSLTISETVHINATPERVWQAITEKDQLEVWWSPNEWHISAHEVGGKVKFGEAGDYSTATIAVYDAPREYRLEWEAGYGFPALTTVYRLEAEHGGTTLHLRESGFEALPEDVRQKRVESTSNGYKQVMQDLKHYVEANT
jgi:uncharacterized protein YndB with AHSA1/START domain